METAKVFVTGRSQAIRLPKKFRFSCKEVRIVKKGNQIILSPISSREALAEFLAMPTYPDFEIDRTDGQKMQNRDIF